MDEANIKHIADGIRERYEKVDELGRAILVDVIEGHIKFFELEGIQYDRRQFMKDCGMGV